MANHKDLMGRLASGEVLLGDGSYIMTLEKRGYATAGSWTPESAAEHPAAVEQLGIEFARAGADITQTFTFWAHEDALPKGCKFSGAEINQAACDIAKKVSRSKGTIVAGGITQTGTFALGKSVKTKVQDDLRQALEVLIKNEVDLIICEYFRNILEMEWAIEVALEYDIPVAATMCMGPGGDDSGVGVGECAVRMAKAGAMLVGVNCLFDPFICIEVLKKMKVALDAFELTPYLMAQPLGYRVPDGGSFGWVDVPEFPFSVEPRQITRWEARKWARQAFQLGVRYIGGCCGFEPYHIRAMAEELADVRGGLPEASDKSDHDLSIHRGLEEKGLKRYKNKGSLSFWMEHEPATGRTRSSALCCQDNPAAVHPGVLS